MKYQGVKKTIRRPIWLNYKPHFCPVCKEKLIKVEVSKIVNWKSEEAKNFDFGSFESSMTGDVKFIWEELHCPTCNINYKLDEIYYFELREKRNAKKTN